eukprot:ANDGO_01968.mRNA.1 DDE superfamily endonuclease containing protein
MRFLAQEQHFDQILEYSNTGPSLDYIQKALLKKDADLKICRSKKGWIYSTLFVQFLEDLKLQLPAERRDAKIMLIVDGHSSHTTIEAVEWCCANNWELVTFPPHCTHKMQPLDVECYKIVKNAFRYEKHGMGEHGVEIGKHVLLRDSGCNRIRPASHLNVPMVIMRILMTMIITMMMTLQKATKEPHQWDRNRGSRHGWNAALQGWMMSSIPAANR